MKMKKCLLLLLSLSLLFSLLSIGVAADTHDHSSSTTTAEKTVFGIWETGDFISLCIAAVVLVVVIVLCIVKRKKLVEALRSYRSEMKKITWYSKKDTVKSSGLVIAVLVVFAIILGAVDWSFGSLIALLGSLFN